MQFLNPSPAHSSSAMGRAGWIPSLGSKIGFPLFAIGRWVRCRDEHSEPNRNRAPLPILRIGSKAFLSNTSLLEAKH
jgi:hypothetical protein